MKTSILSYASSLGFDRVGCARADRLSDDGARYESWLADGFAGSMEYLKRDPEKRYDPSNFFQGAQTVIVVAANYYSDSPIDPSGRVARYAWGKDYHTVLRKRLDSLIRYIEMLAPGVECRTFVDTGPLLERAYAQKAGIGFVGKNTCILTKGVGSFVFLGSVLTTLALEADAPDGRSCGSCMRCIDACPTGALDKPFALDSRKCISYLTIENRGEIPEKLRPLMGEWVYGCDICQDVCPHNTRLPETQIPDWKTPQAWAALGDDVLTGLLQLESDEAFHAKLDGSPMKRAKREGLVRNACVTAANTGRTDLLPQLQRLVQQDASAMIREHASWAIRQLTK